MVWDVVFLNVKTDIKYKKMVFIPYAGVKAKTSALLCSLIRTFIDCLQDLWVLLNTVIYPKGANRPEEIA